MRTNKLKTMARTGQVAINAWVSMGNGYLAEILGSSGFDAVTVDLQHGPYGFDTAVQLLQSISSTPAVPLARSAGGTLAEINKLLDAGAYGVICPLIDTVDEAAAFARACRYPPLGIRSFGPARGLTYGGSDYVQHANEEVLSLAMIETPAAVDVIERILGVEELDGIYIGPSDLGLAMGLGPSSWPAPRMKDVVEHILKVARRCGKYAGIFAGTPSMALDAAALRFDLVTPGNDASQIRDAATQRISAIRNSGPRVG